MLNLVPIVVEAGTAGIVHMAAPDHGLRFQYLEGVEVGLVLRF